MSRCKQLVIREWRGCKTREKQTVKRNNSKTLGQGPFFPLKGYTVSIFELFCSYWRVSLVVKWQWSAGARDAGDVGLISRSGGSPGERNGYLLQYSCLGISWAEEPDGLQSMGTQRVGYDWENSIFTFIYIYIYMCVFVCVCILPLPKLVLELLLGS